MRLSLCYHGTHVTPHKTDQEQFRKCRPCQRMLHRRYVTKQTLTCEGTCQHYNNRSSSQQKPSFCCSIVSSIMHADRLFLIGRTYCASRTLASHGCAPISPEGLSTAPLHLTLHAMTSLTHPKQRSTINPGKPNRALRANDFGKSTAYSDDSSSSFHLVITRPNA